MFLGRVAGAALRTVAVVYLLRKIFAWLKTGIYAHSPGCHANRRKYKVTCPRFSFPKNVSKNAHHGIIWPHEETWFYEGGSYYWQWDGQLWKFCAEVEMTSLGCVEMDCFWETLHGEYAKYYGSDPRVWPLIPRDVVVWKAVGHKLAEKLPEESLCQVIGNYVTD